MQGKLYQYHLTSELAKKYSHVTYLASLINPQRGHSEPEHQVILKLFASSLFRFPSEREKLLSKAQRLKELDHPHLVPLLDMGIEQDQPFVVREYVPNGSLRSHLRKRSPHPLELREALSMVSQVGSALAYAHEHNIVHGSLHPENILLDVGEQVVLTDFNLTNKNDALIRDQTTKEYAFCYMAPEQFAGTCNAKSDQYALGCLAYELITGHVPFAAQSLVSMLGHYSHTEPVPLSERSVDVPPSLEIAVLKALAKDPNERFDDLLLFLDVIQSMVSSSPAFPAFPFTSAPHSRSTRTIAHAIKSTKAETVVSPIRKRAAKRSAPEQPEPSQAFFNAVADLTEPAMTKEASVIIPSVLSSHEIGTWVSEHESTIASNASVASTDSPDPVASQSHDDAVFFSEAHSNANQTCSQEDANDEWLTHLLGEREHDDLPASVSANPIHEQRGSERDEIILMVPHTSDRDIPLRKPSQHDRRKFLALALVCLVILVPVIAAVGTYAAFFPLRTSKPEKPVHLIQVPSQVIPVIENLPIPTPTPAPQAIAPVRVIPTVIPMPTPTPTSKILQTTTIDDSVQGTGLNQFNYVGSGWQHSINNCDANPCEYNNSDSWDHTNVNDYVTLTFTGVQIRFYSVLDSKHGIGAVSLDGGSETMIDLYAATRAGDQLVWTSPMVSAGTHTFKFRVTGNKNPSSSDFCVVVDRVDILS